MHASLAELLEKLRIGLLWVTRDGIVRYANGDGAARTGLARAARCTTPTWPGRSASRWLRGCRARSRPWAWAWPPAANCRAE